MTTTTTTTFGQEIDNRDLTETWIHTRVEVNPFELFANAIANAHPKLARVLEIAINNMPSYYELCGIDPNLIKEDQDLETLYQEVLRRLYQELTRQ